METIRSKTVQRAAIVRPAAVPAPAARRVQASSLRVSSPADAAEKEAEATARRVVAMPESGVRDGRKTASPHVARFAGAMRQPEEVQRKGEGAPNVGANVAAEIQAASGSGSPLPLSVRRFMEPRFKADFSGVRIHTGEKSAKLNRQLNARAFAVGEQIFFGRGQFRPETAEGRELIAHELTHTVQQGAAPPQARRSEDVSVAQQSPRQVQRLGLSDALDHFAGAANAIPGFRMFTIVLGVNPINMSRVERSAANILRALVEFIPGGALIVAALDNYGIFEKAGTWVEQQIKALGMTGSLIRDGIDRFLDSLSWSDIFDLGGVWERAKSIFTEPIGRIIDTAKSIGIGIITFVKDAIVRPLAGLAEGTRGYDLLKAVMGKDPITGDAFPRNADTLIGGFMKLIGQEEVWGNLKKANAVARAWAWFQGALAALMGFVEAIPATFMTAVKSLEIADLVLLPRAFAKVAGVFGNFIGSFISWAGNAVWNLLEIVFDVVSPGAFGYIKKTGGALKSILRNPLPFVGNLVKAAKLGFSNFAANFGTHLKAGLIEWLTGSMPGIYIPKAFSLGEIVKFVFSVLGISWANIRAKLVKAVGETAVTVLETTFDVVSTLVTQGPAAAWDKIKEQLGSLKDMVIGGITDFVVDAVTKKAVPKLLALFIPGAGFISAILTIYDTVMVFVNKISKIAQVVTGFINSIVSIASGAIGAAASRVENTLAGLLSLAISFLAGFAGLGNVSAKLMGIINSKVRAPIDKALDAMVAWIVATAKKLGKFLVKGAKSVVDAVSTWWKTRVPFTSHKGKSHKLFFSGEGEGARLKVASAEMFTEEFIARVEAVFAADPQAKAFGATYLSRARGKKADVDRAKSMVEQARKGQLVGVKMYEKKLQEAVGYLAVEVGFLVDLLPENQVTTLEVQAGDFVSIPYRGTTRRAEILTISKDRLHYYMDALSEQGTLTTTSFLARWKKDIVPSPEKGSRETYVGSTPGKASATGRTLIRVVYLEAKPTRIRTTEKGVVEVRWNDSDPDSWHPLADCDMSHHPTDAVDYWNDTGRLYGPKAPEVRAWMLDYKNYMLEPASINRSRASKNNSRYKHP